MKPLPSQQRAVLKRSSLIEAAIEEFSLDGFEVATAKSIAARAGVATGTFYQYFENKNDILQVIALNRFEHLRDQLQLTPMNQVLNANAQNNVEAIFVQVLHFVYDFHALAPQLHQVLEQRRIVDEELSLIMLQGERVLRNRVLAFVRTFNIDDDQIVADNLFAMAEGVIHSLVFSIQESDHDSAILNAAKMLAAFFQQQSMPASS